MLAKRECTGMQEISKSHNTFLEIYVDLNPKESHCLLSFCQFTVCFLIDVSCEKKRSLRHPVKISPTVVVKCHVTRFWSPSLTSFISAPVRRWVLHQSIILRNWSDIFKPTCLWVLSLQVDYCCISARCWPTATAPSYAVTKVQFVLMV